MELVKSLINILYPPVCPICTKVIRGTDGESCVCDKCRQKLVYVGEARCMRCGKPLKDENAEFCYDCGRLKHVYDQGVAVFEYGDGIKQSIYRFKYKGCREFSKWYGKEMYAACGQQLAIWKPDVIIPVPMYEKKRRQRGYNQAELIADELGRQSGIKVDASTLIRSRATAPMKALNDAERAENIKKAFTICSNIIEYKKVVLVDDIYTTGATVDACARVLKAAGVMKVYCISLCIGRGI